MATPLEPPAEPTTEEKNATIRKKMDSGVIQIRSGNRWVMYDQKVLEKALNRSNLDLVNEGKKKLTRQIRVVTAKDL